MEVAGLLIISKTEAHGLVNRTGSILVMNLSFARRSYNSILYEWALTTGDRVGFCTSKLRCSSWYVQCRRWPVDICPKINHAPWRLSKYVITIRHYELTPWRNSNVLAIRLLFISKRSRAHVKGFARYLHLKNSKPPGDYHELVVL